MTATRGINIVLGKAILAGVSAMAIMGGVIVLDYHTNIPPYWLRPQVLAWLFVGALYVLSAIYLALDELAGVDVPTEQWLVLLLFGGLVLAGVNRAHIFSNDTALVIAEYSLVFAALLLWSLIVSLIIASNSVPPIHQRVLVQLRRIRDSIR